MMEYINNDILEQQKHIIEYLENAVPGGRWEDTTDERRLFAFALLEWIIGRNEYVDEQMKQRLLRYATGENLDAIGETRSCLRIQAAKAKTILEFSIKSPKNFNILIDQGTRATNDGIHFFATIENCMIQAGETSVTVEAEATVAGADHNGIHEGYINILVDQIPNVDSVVNITSSYGGNGIEDDEHYRERIRGYPDSFSTAGPAKAYRQFAMAANPDIADVLVLTDEETMEIDLPVYGEYAFFPNQRASIIEHDGEELTIENENFKIHAPDKESVHVKITRSLEGKVIIIPIMYGGEIPTDEVIHQVLDKCNEADIRPLTDWVIVRKPDPVPYDIELKYYTTKDIEAQCMDEMEDPENGAIARYIKWQDEHLNQDINPDRLRKLMLGSEHAPYRIDVVKPTYTELLQAQVPKFSGNMTITHEVIYG